MRLPISLDDERVSELDERVGPRGRSAFIANSVRAALDSAARWDGILAALGSEPSFMADVDDPSAWVREQRTNDARRIG